MLVGIHDTVHMIRWEEQIMYIIVYTSMHTWHCTYHKVRRKKACTLLYIPVDIHDTVLLSYVQFHVYLLVYTIMYMLYSSDLIIWTVSCISTGIYNSVHAFFLLTLWYVQCHVCILVYYTSRYRGHFTYDKVRRKSMYSIVYTSRYTWHCTYDKVRRIKHVHYCVCQ
jgi:hypothetical protein